MSEHDPVSAAPRDGTRTPEITEALERVHSLFGCYCEDTDKARALDALIAAARSAPSAPVAPAETTGKIAWAIVQDVADLPDRQSPDDWPDAMLVTGEELAMIVERHLPVAPASGEPTHVLEELKDIAHRPSYGIDPRADGSWGYVRRWRGPLSDNERELWMRVIHGSTDAEAARDERGYKVAALKLLLQSVADRTQRPKTSPTRQRLGEMLRELEVVIQSYESGLPAPMKSAGGEAALFAQWHEARERLFDGLSDLTAENERLRETVAGWKLAVQNKQAIIDDLDNTVERLSSAAPVGRDEAKQTQLRIEIAKLREIFADLDLADSLDENQRLFAGIAVDTLERALLPARPESNDAAKPSMFYWDYDDTENGMNDLDDLAIAKAEDEDARTLVFRVQRARILSDVWAAVRPDPKNPDCPMVTEHPTKEEAEAAVAEVSDA